MRNKLREFPQFLFQSQETKWDNVEKLLRKNENFLHLIHKVIRHDRYRCS